jgi:hypothetical protein
VVLGGDDFSELVGHAWGEINPEPEK